MLQVTEHTMQSWDGTELFYRAWRPQEKPKRAIILFHRGHEHSGRWADVVERLDLPGFLSSPGTRAGMAARRANAAMRSISATWSRTWPASCGMSRRNPASSTETSW